MNIIIAFLYEELEERIYIEQSEEYIVSDKEDHVLLLLKSFYELKQASYVWFKTIISEFIKFDYRKCESNHGIWIKFESNEKRMFIIFYMNDFLIMIKDNEELTSLKRELTIYFKMKDIKEIK